MKNAQLKNESELVSSARSPLPEDHRLTEQTKARGPKMEEDEKVSLLMILERPVGESHHILVLKEPHRRKIFP